MFFRGLLLCTCLTTLAFPALAQDGVPVPGLKPRVEGNLRAGTERSIAMTEFWVPLAQDSDSVIYGDARFMGDDKDNNEFNLGVGYRRIVTNVPVLGNGVAGVHGWVDRRHTERGSAFNQITAGAEWHGEVVDLKANAYIPLNKDKTYGAGAAASAPYLAGSGIFYDISNFTITEEAQPGLDLELGLNVSGLVDGFADSARVYAGAYHFAGDKSDDVTGWRARVAADVTPDVQLGARFQRDDERGSQGFLEATIRFPFGNKQSYRQNGLYARLDESPERDIDIVTATAQPVVSGPVQSTPVLNAASGTAQRVLYVDNSAAGGGTGTLDNPFNTLAAAQAALLDNDVVYIARGDGTTTNMNTGFAINRSGVSLIGEGSAFVYDGGKFTTGGADFSGLTLKAAGLAPVITNGAGHGLTVTGANTYLSGFTVNGASGDGILVDANNIDLQSITMRNIAATNNGRMGVYLHGYNNGAMTATVESAATTGNAQHGIAVYDDTSGTFEVDLGGGGRSIGRNTLSGNTLEDLAIDYDGRAISAMNNWWGQASGPDQDAPNVGIRPQIYYGAPMNDGLAGHWTFDTEWTTNTTAYDRSGQNNNGTLQGGLSLADLVAGQNREALSFDGVDDWVRMNNAPSLNFGSGDFSITAKVLPVRVGWNSIVNKGSAGAVGYGIEVGPAGTFAASIQFNSNQHQHTPIVLGQAQMLSAVYDRDADIRQYIDGALVQTSPYAGGNGAGSINNVAALAIGSYSTGAAWHFQSYIDEVRIYNRVLSAPEVAELHRMDTSSIVDVGGFLTSAP